MESNVSGLVELVLVVGLLVWFWRSQTAATRKDASSSDTDQPAAPKDPRGPLKKG